MSGTDKDTEGTVAEPTSPAPRNGGGFGRTMRRILFGLFVLAVLTGGGVAALFHWAQGVYQGPGPLAVQAVLVIESGSGLQRIASELQDAGIIDQREVFIAMLRYTGQHRQLKAGEYSFEPGISQRDVVDKLVAHQVVRRSLTVPEGRTVAEIMDIIASAEGLDGEMPDPLPPEGSLLPETYQYQRGDSRAEVIARMQEAMADTLDALWQGRAENLPLATPEEAVVLASIIEKETGVAAERARIAGVFINRLRRGMRLQSDPTVVYALTGGTGPLGRALTRQDWKVDNPYNTYLIIGLPPGPIASPGQDALAAALQPMATKDLYFVADGTGGHAFAETLAEHNRNVVKWRRIRDSQ